MYTERGFTLIELMMVIAILAIIVAVAIPAYNNQVQKARRADATSALLNGAQQLERCFTRFNAYDAGGCPNPAGLTEDGFYNITVNRNETSFDLSAAPQGVQSSDPCGTFTLDHLGNRGADSETDRCWGS